MKIAVCDDNGADLRKLCGMVRLYCERNNLIASVEGFQSGAELLRRMRKESYAVVFLDIFLENEHGVDLARTIRKRSGDCILFFCTVSKSFALDGYEVNALHYLVKPFSYGEVEHAMDRCGDRLLSMARTLVTAPKQGVKVLVKDILFVEALERLCHVHTVTQVEVTRKTIKSLEKELGNAGFLRCHRSYIVNLKHVVEYTEADFVLCNGMRISIRQKERGKVKQAYRNYATMQVAQKI